MIKFIDDFLNKITMYKIVLYVLIALALSAILLSFVGFLGYNPWALLFSLFYITTISLITNMIFAWVYDVPANVESVYITALILFLIIDPITAITSQSFFLLATFASILAMASKYMLAIGKKHIANPAAIAVVLTGIFLGQTASWWVGSAWMFPVVLIGGYLIVKKIHRFDLVGSFFIVALVTIFLTSPAGTGSFIASLWRVLASTPIIFFSTVMLTEPLTTPPTRGLRIIYGAVVGFLFSPMIHIGSIYSTPEIALVVGNIYSYIVSPKAKLILKLKEVKEVAYDTYNFVFKSDKRMKFRPGQYLEWTISDKGADLRGNRRYFTIASSPTENEIIMGVKFYPKPSSFKRQLLEMQPGDKLIASSLSGDFTLPKDKNKKLVLIAGGIGITPFRSMIKNLVDNNEKRDVIVIYSNKKFEDIAYTDVLDEAYHKLDIKTIYTLTDTDSIISKWRGERGYVSGEMILRNIPDWRERTFYISGPHSMVSGSSTVLDKLGVPSTNIKTDFFPGFA